MCSHCPVEPRQELRGQGPYRALKVPLLFSSETIFTSDVLDFWIRLQIPRQNTEWVTFAPFALRVLPALPSECCGALEYYDKAFDRITTRSEKPLRSIKRIFHTVTTTDDPVIRKVGTPSLLTHPSGRPLGTGPSLSCL